MLKLIVEVNSESKLLKRLSAAAKTVALNTPSTNYY